jgi:signal transduction histidine kinase/ABC-type sugar transport system substrate-binding protein/AraC-like DNA-binding protein
VQLVQLMYNTYRVGCNIQLNDTFWVQLREAVYQRAQQLNLNLVPFYRDLSRLYGEAQVALVEELLAQDLDALIGWDLSNGLIERLLDAGLPVLHLHDRSIRHPLFVSPRPLFDAGAMAGRYVGQQLGGRGQIVIVGGMAGHGENGRCRIAGFQSAIADFPHLRVRHMACLWRYEQAYAQILTLMQQSDQRIDAIFGLSDSLALAGRDVGRRLGLVDKRTLIVGINGDPLALTAIAEGEMTATVDTHVNDYGYEVAELAGRAARREPLPEHFEQDQRLLVTNHNVAEIAARKLAAIARIPDQLVGINHQHEQQRLIQLETSLAINRQIGTLLDPHELSHTLANLIRANYGFDHVQLVGWSEADQTLMCEHAGGYERVALANAGVLRQAILRNESILFPDMHRSYRVAPDPSWPNTRSRVVLPMRIGGTIVGLLDLHNQQVVHHSQAELLGLQVLADQVGIAIRNADLYHEALMSRAAAEQADQLKTRLLANVSHELRTPLNVILGYSQVALSSPTTVGYDLSPGLRRDLQHIYKSGEHLMRLINDLLDLSRAEIDELDLFPEAIDTRAFLADVFQSFAASAEAESRLAWRLALPAHLPPIQADPVRLREVLLNLLSNANRFTHQGEIALGAEAAPPNLHIWVHDTGIGIPADQQERIFDPFVTAEEPGRRAQGIGLGLSISRRLLLLHRGMISVESTPGQGSTFHIYLPLPDQAALCTRTETPTLLLISTQAHSSPAVAELCRRGQLAIRRLRPDDTPESVLAVGKPAAIAWDLAHTAPGDWELIERLRVHPRLCLLPFVMIGQAGSGDTPAAAAGLTNVLTKPVSDRTLVETIGALQPNQASGSILIVDDDPHARELYQRLAAAALPDYALYTLGGGRAALELLEHITPSLVILDLTMPEVDGFAVLAYLRARPATQQVPVLIVSSRVLSLDDIKRLDHARVTLHTKNMLTPQETAEVLQRALHGADTLPQPTSTLVKRAVTYLQRHYNQPLSRQDIAGAIGVNKNYLSAIFHQELGISPWDYLNRYRINVAKELLRTTDQSITSIAAQVGFDDSSYFGRVFHKHTGLAPSEYRK